jgi:hypothetical protein
VILVECNEERKEMKSFKLNDSRYALGNYKGFRSKKIGIEHFNSREFE